MDSAGKPSLHPDGFDADALGGVAQALVRGTQRERVHAGGGQMQGVESAQILHLGRLCRPGASSPLLVAEFRNGRILGGLEALREQSFAK
jgi:hypothetical protein